MARIGRLVLCAAILCAASATELRAALIDTLNSHLSAFIANNYPGQMSTTTSEFETISASSDLNALANLITDNFWVINQGAESGAAGTLFVQLTGPEKQAYIDNVLLPKMVNGALVAKVVWTWNTQTVPVYALVNPAASGAGDTANIIEGVTSFYRKQLSSRATYGPVLFYNGFGIQCASYAANLTCDLGTTCGGNSPCNDGCPPCGCESDNVITCPAGNCKMVAAFVGYCGFPSVELQKDKFKFKVSGWGWEYFNDKVTLNEACHCTANALGACIIPNTNNGCLAAVTQSSCEQDFGGAWQGVGTCCSCAASDACHLAGTCDPSTALCSNPTAPDGTGCDDGNACTTSDTCSAGTCVAGPPAADSTPCDDGNACTQTDTCHAGACKGSNPVACAAIDPCHSAGACNPLTGACSNPVQPQGTFCSDGSVCTSSDACKTGTCTGTAIVCNDNNVCTTDTCNPSSGCVFTVNAAPCNDGNSCTSGDVCQGGVCSGTLSPARFPVSIFVSKPTLAGTEPDPNASISWSASVTADLIRGNLFGLRSLHSFAGTVLACLANDLTGTSVSDSVLPGTNGGFYYLARPAGSSTCSGLATYSTGSPREAAGRDSQIAADPNACP